MTSGLPPRSSHAQLPRLALIALCVACLIPVIWPGDIPFINDEPQLIANAVSANRDGQLASFGLLGTYGFIYGPAPTWVYQALVAVSRDLVVVAVLHALLLSVATAAALWWLSRSLRLWVWFAPLPLLSPYFWFYARVLWDNPFLIPLGALAMAGYAAHLESGSSAGLRVSIAALLMIPLVHLMGIALVVPLAAHMLLVRGRALWAHKFSIGAIVAASLLLARSYWIYLVTPHPRRQAADRRSPDGCFRWPGRACSVRRTGLFLRPGPGSGRDSPGAAAVSSAGVCGGMGRDRGRRVLRRAGCSVAQWTRARTWPASRSARSRVRRSSTASAASIITRTTRTRPGSRSCCWRGWRSTSPRVEGAPAGRRPPVPGCSPPRCSPQSARCCSGSIAAAGPGRSTDRRSPISSGSPGRWRGTRPASDVQFQVNLYERFRTRFRNPE